MTKNLGNAQNLNTKCNSGFKIKLIKKDNPQLINDFDIEKDLKLWILLDEINQIKNLMKNFKINIVKKEVKKEIKKEPTKMVWTTQEEFKLLEEWEKDTKQKLENMLLWGKQK